MPLLGSCVGTILRRGKLAATARTSVRRLNLQEYQSKDLLKKHGVSVEQFFVADNISDAEQKFSHFNPEHGKYVVKAQILAGGRGKGRFVDGKQGLGGVFITEDKTKALESVGDMIGHHLETKQTRPGGDLVDKVMVAEAVPIVRELYLAIVMDRECNGPVVVASPAGGVNIEEVAEKTPELIFKEPVDIHKGITDEQCMQLAKNLKFEGELQKKAADQIKLLYELFIAVDATQVEINPFVETKDKRVFCVDAKLNFDDSAAFRQKDIFAMDNNKTKDKREVDAHKYDLNYIGLDGNIACMVNGAGLAMATMDIIKLFGGSPANFLDVGGAVTEEQVFHAFRVITSDPAVEAVLVNIFGGIVNCATIARGIIKACERMHLSVPLVVRLEGTNVDEANKLLENSGLTIITADNLEDAAKKAVNCIS